MKGARPPEGRAGGKSQRGAAAGKRKASGKGKRGTPPPGARELAFDLTRRVNDGGAYLGLLLRYSLGKSRLAPRDRSLVAELCYGVQRHRNLLDHLISQLSDRPLEEIDGAILDVLRLGMYQLYRLGIPGHAAANESVSLAKARLGPGPASFVNAVMRRAVAEKDSLSLPPREDTPEYLEVVHSHPRWLVELLLARMAPEEAEALCVSDNTIPTLTLRANPMRIDAPGLLAKVEERGGAGELSPALREAVREVSLSHPALQDLLCEGLCVVQDEGSMLVGYAVSPGEGDLVVDACAAPGGKATHLATLGGPACRVLAVDVNAKRLEAMKKSVERLGLENVALLQGDAHGLPDLVDGEADLVLVDAPCSGLGTLRRNPELRWRRKPEDLPGFMRLQASLLEAAARTVRPGGAVVYSVCTYTREETSEVVEAFLARHGDFHAADLGAFLPEPYRSSLSPDGYAQLMPHLHGCEGMFIARLERS
ncbi:MAG: 16S rRNA (cytosine(967)-C(5))-methyltransferase RsmB [Actinomycetota bacterium]|nr:16S rRNA (cytosine(967)-C(5))-methyltransferase RsmB [Actinomycetota bacterium]